MYDSASESAALLPNRRRGSNSSDDGSGRVVAKKSAPSTGLMINRIMIILSLAGLVAVSVYLQSLQSQLNSKLSTDEGKIKKLEDTIVTQGEIINRFNESVTNADVKNQLEVLKQSWDEGKLDILNQLSQTRTYVDESLNSTMVELDKIVAKAETEIQDQVDSVKENFDQYVIQTENQFSVENNFMIYQVAGTLTILSCLISMWHMGSHTREMNQPAIQRKILAILWMCPIYAITSFLSLVLPKYSGYLGIIRDSYEAYIIYQFLSFCISVIGGGDRNKAINLLAKRAEQLTPPFRFFFCCRKRDYENDRALANAILTQCQAFTIQFVFWKPVCAISNVMLKRLEYYGPYATDSMDWKSIQFWLNIIQNLSIFIAFAGLLKFYHAVGKELEWCRPFAKFLCIKGVVFMTFWQGMILQILAETTDVGGGGESAGKWSEKIQNFLICLEMLLFAIAHFYCFPVDEWQPGYEANFRKAKFGETMALNDFFTDLKIVMTAQNNYRKDKKRESKNLKKESTIMEEKDGESETEPGSIRSIMTNEDEEDPKEALVRALAGSVGSGDRFEDEDEGEQKQARLQECQQRLGNMLDDMLFSPRNSSQTSPRSTSVGKLSVDDNILLEYEDNLNDSQEYGQRETTGLLTGDSEDSLSNNLKQSIFTALSQQQTQEGPTNFDNGRAVENECVKP